MHQSLQQPGFGSVTPSLKPINERIVIFLRKTSEQWNNDKISNRMYQNKMI